MAQYIDVTDVAKRVRTVLKSAFPGQKFSVKSSRYSMGASVSVRWIDGPTTKEVEAIVKGYQSSDYVDNTDYRVESKKHDPVTGEMVWWGADWVMCDRELSAENKLMLAREVAEKWDFDASQIAVVQHRSYAELQYPSQWDYDRSRPDFRGLNWQAMGERSFYEHPKQTRKAKEAPAPATGANTPAWQVTEEAGEIWIIFDSKPSQEILQQVRPIASWHRKRGAWRVHSATVTEVEAMLAGEAGETPSPAPAQVGDPKVAASLRAKGERLQKQIDAKRNPATASQRPTARRARIIESMYHEGEYLAKIQRILFALADQHEAGAILPALSAVRHKSEIEEILRYKEYPSGTLYTDEQAKFGKLGLTPANYAEARAWVAERAKRGDPEAARKQAIRGAESDLIGARIDGFFPTPPQVIRLMLEHAAIPAGATVLEPSAGKGDIAEAIRAFHPDTCLATVEVNSRLCDLLRLKGFNPEQGDFLNHAGQYDRIIMNPPFERGQDAEHIQHAYSLLRPGGRLIALSSAGLAFRRDAESFRNWLDEVDAYCEPLEQGAFSSAFRSIGVAIRLLVIDK